jgi:hypothetical protein
MFQHRGSLLAVSMFDSPRPARCLATAATSVDTRSAFASIGIDPEEYPHVLETRTYPGHAFATTDIDSPRMDFGRNSQAGMP